MNLHRRLARVSLFAGCTAFILGMIHERAVAQEMIPEVDSAAPTTQKSHWSLFDSSRVASEQAASEPPPYNLLRFEEDYSYLRDPGKRTDPFDPLKFIPLDAKGRVYLTLGGDMRQRFESYSGFGLGNGSVDGKSDAYYLARYLLHADLHVGENLRFFLQLNSNTELGRRGGARPGIDSDDFDVHQAFFDLKIPLHEAAPGGKDAPESPRTGDTTLLIRLGRQELAYGDDKLIDFREGPNVRQSFDAAVVSLQNPDYRVDALFARQVATNKGVLDDGYDLQQAEIWGLYSTVGLPFLRRPHSADTASLDLYYLGYDRQNAAFDQSARRGSSTPLPGHETRHSVGARLDGTAFPLGDGAFTGEFHYNLEGTYQFGRYGDNRISAFSASFDAGYYFQRLLFGPNVTLRVDVISGDSNRRDGRLETYNPLFPTALYFSEPGLIGPSNLIAIHPAIDWHLQKALGLFTTVIGYWREDTGDGIYNFGGVPSVPGPQSGVSPNGAQSLAGARYVGTEANARLTWKINRHLTLDVSYSHFFAGSYARETAALHLIPGGRGAQSFDYLATWMTFSF